MRMTWIKLVINCGDVSTKKTRGPVSVTSVVSQGKQRVSQLWTPQDVAIIVDFPWKVLLVMLRYWLAMAMSKDRECSWNFEGHELSAKVPPPPWHPAVTPGCDTRHQHGLLPRRAFRGLLGRIWAGGKTPQLSGRFARCLAILWSGRRIAGKGLGFHPYLVMFGILRPPDATSTSQAHQDVHIICIHIKLNIHLANWT